MNPETTNKQRYEIPEVEIVEIKAEGMVCASGSGSLNDDTYENQTW